MPSLDGIDNRFRPLLEAMLQPDPANRPASMAEIADWTLGAPLGRQMPDKTVIRTSSPPPEQSALDHEAPPANWGRRILVALSLLGFAGLGAGGVYFIVGQSVPDQDQKPVLVAPPRDNAPEAPTQPTDPTSDDGSSGESTGKETSPTTDDAKNTVPDIPIPDNQDQRPPVNGNETNNNAPPPITPQQDQSQEVLKPEDRIRNFVSSYQAGDCMYLQPVEIASRSAEIEGFASRTPPFIAFDSDFTQSQGFEAKIQVNLVSDDQCPAVAFLRGTPEGNAKTELHLDMQRTVIPNGSNMAGRISGYDPTTGELGLLYVGSKGEVVNLSPFLQTDNGGAGFVVPLSLKSAVEETGLVIAMVGPDVAQSLSNRSEKQASAFLTTSCGRLRSCVQRLRPSRWFHKGPSPMSVNLS